MSTGDLVTNATLSFPVAELAWSADGQRIAAGGEEQLAVIDAGPTSPVWQVDEWRIARSVAFSPDLRSVAVIASNDPWDHRIRMLDATTGEQIWSRTHSTGRPPQVAGTDLGSAFGALLAAGIAGSILEGALDLGELTFSPDGRLLGSIGLLLDTRDGRDRSGLPQGGLGTFSGPLSPAFNPLCPGFSSDSQWLATRSDDGVVLVNTTSGSERWSTPSPGLVVRLIVDERDSRVVAVCNPGNRVLVLDAKNGTVLTDAQLDSTIAITLPFFSGRRPPHYELARDGRLLALVGTSSWGVFRSADGALRFEPRRTPLQSPKLRARFNPTGDLVAVNRSGDGSTHGVTLVLASSGVVVWEDRGVEVLDVAFSPDGRQLAVGGTGADGGFVRFYDAGLERSHWRHEGPVGRLAVTSAGMRLVASAGGDQKVFVFHADSGEPLLERSHPGVVNSVAFSPDGQHMATGGSDGGARLYRTVSSSLPRTVAHGGPVNMVVFTPPGGAALLTASADKTARRLNRDTGAEEWRRGHPQAVTHVAVSPDGRKAATGCADRHSRLIDAGTGAELFRYPHETPVRSLAFGPALGGRALLAAAADETALLVDAATGEEIARMGHPSSVKAVAVSPDGSLLATGMSGSYRAVRLYDLATGEAEPPLLRELEFAAPVRRLVFNPVNGRLAVLTEDAVVRLLDPEDGFELVRFTHPAEVNDMAISADGELLVTACDDRFTRVLPGS